MSALKAFRQQSRIRLVEISKESDISLSKLSLIENGWRLLQPDDIEKLSRAYRKFDLNVDPVLQKMTAE